MLHDSDRKHAGRRKWLQKLGEAGVFAGAIAFVNPVSASVVAERLLEQASLRALLTPIRREEMELPPPLVLEPAGHDEIVLVRGHSSHRSHSAHSSHRSSSSYAPSYIPPRYIPPPSPVPEYSPPKRPSVSKGSSNLRGQRSGETDFSAQPLASFARQQEVYFKDGSCLVGVVDGRGAQVAIQTEFGVFSALPDDISSKIPKQSTTTSGQCLVSLNTGKSIRADVTEEDSDFVLKFKGQTFRVAKTSVVRVLQLSGPVREPMLDLPSWYLVTLTGGSQILGKVARADDRFTVHFRYGTVTLSTEQIRYFEKPRLVYATSIENVIPEL